MSEKYYQEYGPISRRRATGELNAERPLSGGPAPEIEPPPRRRPRRTSQRRLHARVWRLWLLIVLCTGLLVLLAFPYATSLFASERALDGVSMQGQPVGGLGHNQLRDLLNQRYGQFIRAPLTISFEGHTWTPTLEQLGVQFEADRTIEAVLAKGRSGGPIERLEDQSALWQGGMDVAVYLSIDARKLQLYLNTLALEIEHPPRDAALSIAAGKVIPTPAQDGRQVLADETAINIIRALQTLTPQSVVLRTRLLKPSLTDEGIAQAVKDARALLGGPLLLQNGTQSWVWEPDKISELLTVKVANERMSIAIDPERLTRAVEKFAQVVDSPSVEPRVAFGKSRLTITRPGKTGWRLKQNEAVQAISSTLRLPVRKVELPVEELTPQVTAKTLSSLGIVELLGQGQTSFAGSASYRITNIKAGAARINGVLIPPDAEFSFNTQLGAVDETNGFVQGYAVIGNRTQLEWGGGVCQDSTTVFRAAFWAGLPITERHAHPFYISWYDAYSYPGGEDGPGMDATIYTGVQDLKFKNDTAHWLLMEAHVDESGQILSVRLYGTKPDRTVSLVGPETSNVVPPPATPVYVSDASLPAGTVKQTDSARKGMDITVYRIITEKGVRRIPEAFFTRFKAWPDVFVRGTG